MKIAVLASNKNLYSNKRLMAAGEKRGHEMRFVNIQHCYMDVTSKKPEIHYRGGEILNRFDAVIPRIKPSMTEYACSVLRQFDMQGSYLLNGPVSIARAQDKLRTLQLLCSKDINIPRTAFAYSPQDTKHVIEMLGGAPVVIKLLEGTQGRGVVLAESEKAAESLINAFKSVQANILVQEFIKESRGVDLRCFVVGDTVVGAIERHAAEGEFRANIHLGGTGHKVKLTAEERRMSIETAKAVGLKVCGVDMMRSSTGPKVIEVNASPGLEGIETTTNKDIADMMIQHIETATRMRRFRSWSDKLLAANGN